MLRTHVGLLIGFRMMLSNKTQHVLYPEFEVRTFALLPWRSPVESPTTQAPLQIPR